MRRSGGIAAFGGNPGATLCVACTMLTAVPAAACVDVPLASPERGSVVHDSRPTIAWHPVPGIHQYRLQMEVRIPNGRIVARSDQVVAGTSYSPPSPLAEDFVGVKVRVSASCPADAPANVSELGPAFFIDPRSACPAPREVQLRTGTALQVSWKADAAMTQAEVSLFSADDGTLLARRASDAPVVELPPPSKPAVLAMRARCRAGASALVYRVLAGAR